MSQKLSSQGSFVEVMDPNASPDTWVVIGGVRSVTGIRSGTRAEIETTDLLSDAKEFILGLKDNGTMNLGLFYDPADPGQIILEDLLDASVSNPFRISVPNPLNSPPVTTLTYDGRVTSFPFDLEVDAAIPGTVAVRVTGDFVKG